MGLRADIREEVRKETVSKIHGQPANQDLTLLEKVLLVILANIPTTLRGGGHGHAGIVMDPARYLLTTGVPFVNPANPGTRSSSESGSRTQRTCERAQNIPRSSPSNKGHHSRSSEQQILTGN